MSFFNDYGNGDPNGGDQSGNGFPANLSSLSSLGTMSQPTTTSATPSPTVPPGTPPGQIVGGGATQQQWIDSIITGLVNGGGYFNPSIQNDPNYWYQAIANSGGLNSGNVAYWAQKMRTPEGPPAGYAQGGPFPAFQPPSYQDFLNSPGLQFGLDQGLKAITENGSAKGTALGGPQLKALSDYATNYGLTQYGNFFNQALETNQQNFGINQGLFGNQYSLYSLGLNAARNP